MAGFETRTVQPEHLRNNTKHINKRPEKNTELFVLKMAVRVITEL